MSTKRHVHKDKLGHHKRNEKRSITRTIHMLTKNLISSRPLNIYIYKPLGPHCLTFVNPFDSQKHRKEYAEKESTLKRAGCPQKAREKKNSPFRKTLDTYTRKSHGQMITGCLKNKRVRMRRMCLIEMIIFSLPVAEVT